MAAQQSQTTNMVKVKFTKSPTGAFGLGYTIGDEAEVRQELAIELIDRGYAVPIVEAKVEKAVKKPKYEKRTK